MPANVTLKSDDAVTLILVPEGAAGKAAPAEVVAADGSFTVKGADGKGALPGKYTITVHIMTYPGAPESPQRAKQFNSINDQYGTAPTKLTYEVTSEPQQSITVDLAKGTVTKQ